MAKPTSALTKKALIAAADKAFAEEMKGLIGHRLKKAKHPLYVERWLELELQLFPENPELTIQKEVEKATSLSTQIAEKYAGPSTIGKAAEKAASLSEQIFDKWDEYSNPAHLTLDQQRAEIAKKKKDIADTQEWLQKKYDGIPLLRHLPALKGIYYLYGKVDRANEWIAKKQIGIANFFLPKIGTDRRKWLETIGPVAYVGAKIFNSVGSILSGIGLLAGIGAGIFGASAFFTGGAGAVPAAFCGVVALETAKWGILAKAGALGLQTVYSVHQASLIEQGLVSEEQAIEHFKDYNLGLIDAVIDLKNRGKTLEELADAKDKLATARELAKRIRPPLLVGMGNRLRQFLGKITGLLARTPAQLGTIAKNLAIDGLKAGLAKVMGLPDLILNWGNKLESLHEWIERIEKAKEFAADVGKSIVKGGAKIVSAGKGLFNKLKGRAADLVDTGIEKTKRFGSSIWDKGMALAKAAKNKLLPDLAEQDSQGVTYNDGDMTGPWYPDGWTGPMYSNPAEAAAAGPNVAIFVNGVRTNLEAHSYGAQELANQRKKPVVGIWNASGENKGGFGMVRDFAQCLGDKLGLDGNPATKTLANLIVKHGNASGKNGGLDIYGHSQGSIIVSDAMSKARDAGGKGVLTGLDITTMGNAIATIPEGAKSYTHAVYDADLVTALSGSTSIINQAFLDNKIAKLLLKTMGLRSTLQDSYVLHSGLDAVRAHGVIPDVVQEDGHDKVDAHGKKIYDDKDYYIKALPHFQAEKANAKAFRDGAAKAGIDSTRLLPLRQTASTLFAVLRSSSASLADKIESAYQKVSPKIVSSPQFGLPGISGLAADKMLRAAGRGAKEGGSLLGKGWDWMWRLGDAADPRTNSKIQRKGTGSDPDADPEGLRQELVKTGGSGFSPSSQVRAELAPHLGFDPSQARLHVGPGAAAAARDMGAEAFTIGRDVFFGAGKFDPASREGLGLIAHELTHVGQQTAASNTAHRFTREGGDAMEQEAQKTAEMFLATSGPTKGLVVQHRDCHYLCEEEALTADQELRLQRIFDSAIHIAGLSTKSSVNGDFLEAIDVEVTIDLNGMSDDQSARYFADKILAQISLATTAAASASPPSTFAKIQKYDSDEHAMMGGPLDKQETVTIKGVKIKYGHLIAMGDFFTNPQEILKKADAKKLQTIVDLIDKKLKDPNSVGDDDWQLATGGAYLKLAEANDEHFAPSNPSLIAPKKGGSGGNHKQLFEKYHKEAIQLAKSGHKDEAMATNAFADHFLTDAFASGHLFNKQDLMASFRAALAGKNVLKNMTDAVAKEAWKSKTVSDHLSKYETVETHWGVHKNIDSDWMLSELLQGIDAERPQIIENAIAKVLHDKLNEMGVEVSNPNATWKLSGDEHLNPESLKQSRLAVEQSKKDILDSAAGSAPADPMAKVWALVPKPTAAGTKSIQEQIASLANPSSKQTIGAVAQFIRDKVFMIVDELVKEKKLQPDGFQHVPGQGAGQAVSKRKSVLGLEPPAPPTKADSKPDSKSANNDPGFKAMMARFNEGMRDENDLTDVAYFARHPERKKELIDLEDKKAVKEWIQIRNNMVRPLLKRAEAKVQKSAIPGTEKHLTSAEQAAEHVENRVRQGGPPEPVEIFKTGLEVQRKDGDKDKKNKKLQSKPVIVPKVKGPAPSNAMLVQVATSAARGKVGWIQRMGAAGEASAMAILRSLGATVKDLNDFTPKSHNFPTLDIISNQGAQSVKVKATHTEFTEKTAEAYIKDFRQLLDPKGLKSASERIYHHRGAIQAAGAWPEGLAKDAPPEVIAKFLSKHSQLAIPQDHLAGVQKALEAKVRSNPEAYGLKGVKGNTPAFNKGVEAIVGRVKSIGITSGQIDGIIMPMVKSGPESKPKENAKETAKEVAKPPPPPNDAPASYAELVKNGQPVPPDVEMAVREAARIKNVGRVQAVFKYGGKIFLVYGIYNDSVYIMRAEDKLKAVVEVGGGWGGATAASLVFSAWFAPADTAGPLAWGVHGVGALVAGGVGYYFGKETTKYVYEVTVEGKPIVIPRW